MVFLWFFAFLSMIDPLSAQLQPARVSLRRDDSLLSVPLNRRVRLDIILPPGYNPLSPRIYPVLYLNDGQDLPRLRLRQTLDSLYQQNAIQPFVLVAIHAGDRIQEYGTAARPDYMHRGSKAAAYTDFMLTELLPYVQRHYPVSANPHRTVIAGFSLGGLSAFDIAFHHPARFGQAGVFSGSFWWRSRAFTTAYNDDTDRLMHSLVRAGRADPAQQFWFQAGTLDETDDRNQNGVIDAIDDTLDLIRELEKKGLSRARNLRYVEVEGGHHNPDTWGAVMPQFLQWAFGWPK
jgi:enterochelin esterase-like enzyme